jgi:uncharacterized membrane protein
MMLRWDVLLAIIGMAAVTFACRAGGYVVLRAIRPPPFVEAMLRHIPGPLFAAYVALALSNMGPAAWLSAACVILAQWRVGSIGLSILVGVAVLALLRPVLG